MTPEARIREAYAIAELQTSQLVDPLLRQIDALIATKGLINMDWQAYEQLNAQKAQAHKSIATELNIRLALIEMERV